jgi:2-polyprenyl-3-methyl-5-hydroxy-6-metoxy-1,4-benzoquinol methylase
MSNPTSPVTGSGDTQLTDTFLSSHTISLYKEQFGIDVNRFFKNDHFSMYRCNQTGYRFYHPEGLDGDGEFYASLQSKLGEGYYHGWKFENQLAYDHINPTDKVLDIGCGVGNFLVKAKEKAAEVCGLELNEKAVAVCKQKGLSVHNELIAAHAEKKEGYYDMVCMFQVLEHIYDIRSFLDDSLKALKKGGKLIIGVPNSEPYFNSYDKYSTLNLPPHHMGLWNKEVFKKIGTIFNVEMQEFEYDTKGKPLVTAYLRAKYMGNIHTAAGKHTTAEKIKMLLYGIITVPLSFIKKYTKGINGAHIAVVFKKL